MLWVAPSYSLLVCAWLQICSLSLFDVIIDVVNRTSIIVRRYVKSVCLLKRPSSHWVISVEFYSLFFIYCKIFDIRFVASFDMSLLLSTGGNIQSVIPPFLILYSFSKDLMIDITYIFMLINNLMCLESNAICMFFLQTVNGKSTHICIDTTTIKEFYYV